MATKTVARVPAVHKFEGKEFRVKRGQDLTDLPKALVPKLKQAGLTMEVEVDEVVDNKSSNK